MPTPAKVSFWTHQKLLAFFTEFKGQFKLTGDRRQEHHNEQPSLLRKEFDSVSKIKAALLSNGNPFPGDGDCLYNFTRQSRLIKAED